MGVALGGVGGGLSAQTQRALVHRGWMSAAEFAETQALAQLSPGPNAVNVAAAVGAQLGGKRGALAAVCGILAPGLLCMTVLSWLLLSHPGRLPPAVSSGLRGAACAGLAILLSTVWPMVRVGWQLRGGPQITLAALISLGLLGWPLLPVLTLLIGLGVYLNRPGQPPARGAAAPPVGPESSRSVFNRPVASRPVASHTVASRPSSSRQRRPRP